MLKHYQNQRKTTQLFGEMNVLLIHQEIHQVSHSIKVKRLSEIHYAPDGSRYIIYAAWKNRSAHVFIAEKENGIIRYIDPQPNRDDVEYYFSLAKENKFGILRVDDKDITTDVSKLSATVRW